MNGSPEDAAKMATEIWNSATPATADHPYIKAKQIDPEGLRIAAPGQTIPIPAKSGRTWDMDISGALLSPVHDIHNDIQSLQVYVPSNDANDKYNKINLPGSRMKGGHMAIGHLSDDPPAIVFAEGVATAKEVNNLTDLPTVATYSAGNIMSVAQQYRERYPNSAFVFAADNDPWKNGTVVGIDKATDAAHQFGGVVVAPNFHGNGTQWNDGTRGTDWNDLSRASGKEEARRQIFEQMLEDDYYARRMGINRPFKEEMKSNITRQQSPDPIEEIPPQRMVRQLSEDGMMALGAVYSKIDNQWSDRTTKEREALKERAVQGMAAHERENGDIQLTPEQRRALWREQNISRAPDSGQEKSSGNVWITQSYQEPGKQKSDAMSWLDSAAILKSYYIESQESARFYYKTHKDIEPAIIASETKIIGSHGDSKTIRDMVEIAHARNWQSIDIGGHKEHAQEMWIEAKARGIEAKGYTPTDRDQQEATRRSTERTVQQTPAQDTPQYQPEQAMWKERAGGKERTRTR